MRAAEAAVVAELEEGDAAGWTLGAGGGILVDLREIALAGLGGILLLLRLVEVFLGTRLAQMDLLEPVLTENLGDVQGGLFRTALALDHRPAPAAARGESGGGERILAPPARVVSGTPACGQSVEVESRTAGPCFSVSCPLAYYPLVLPQCFSLGYPPSPLVFA